MKYDYVVVGAGLFGSVFTHEALQAGKKVLVLERRSHPGGNVYCEHRDGIDIHLYGAHIFHTQNRKVWDYVHQFTSFNHYINSPIANFRGKLFNLPFNMNTFHQMWPDVITPEDAKKKITEQRREITGPITNLEEQAISLVGRDIYETLIKGYTEKQWGRDCTELPPSIITRIPVRYRYDNNYFNDPYQGIPTIGYNALISRLLDTADVLLDTDYTVDRDYWDRMGKTVVYTGALDRYFNFHKGKLAYRSVYFEHVKVETGNYQGVAVMNYTDRETAYTRVIEHAHFSFTEQPISWISYEYPIEYEKTNEPYYPIRDEQNLTLYEQYRRLADQTPNLLYGGRLAEYAYYDMDTTIASALALAKRTLD